MPLPGVVPFPPEFAQHYRDKGYWQDKSLAEEFAVCFHEYKDRLFLIDGERRYTYAELDAATDNLALNLLELGLKPLDRVVPTLPTCAEFVLLYFALQKIGAIPIAALVTHRFAEINQFVQLSGASMCVYPERQGDFEFEPMIQRVKAGNLCLRFCVSLPQLSELIARKPELQKSELQKIRIYPTDPCIFQLSGGTTGIPKLIPRTHNDYAYNSKTAAPVCGVTKDSVLLVALPIAHNLPLACPGIQGYFFQGGKVVVSPTTRPEEMLGLIEKHRVTHLKVVPALLIRLITDPSIGRFDLSSLKVIQSGGQRMQPEVRLKTRELIPSAFVQENFGMSEGMIFFVRRNDPEEVKLETCGRPISPDDEVRLVDDEGREVPDGEVGELTCRGPYTLRGYYGVPEYNAKQFTSDGFYCSGDLMRRHPSGNYVVEGRKKDLVNRGGEKISAEEIENLILSHPAVQNVACVPVPDPKLGEKMCACLILKPGKQLELPELVDYLKSKEIAKFKLPERMMVVDDFPVSTFGKVSKKTLSELAQKNANH
jgi:2,3-dihydroxybenzoate-AMP ligase